MTTNGAKYPVWAWGFVLVCVALTPAVASVGGEAPPQVATEEVPVTPPKVLPKSQKPPIYPPAALAARFTGTVVLDFTVKKDGSVGDVVVVECSHEKLGFEGAAIAAVEQWRFEPAMSEGAPVEFSAKYRLNFRGAAAGIGFQPYASAGGGGGANQPSNEDRRERDQAAVATGSSGKSSPKQR